MDGDLEGVRVGTKEGDFEGTLLGINEGDLDGIIEGDLDGDVVIGVGSGVSDRASMSNELMVNEWVGSLPPI